ALAPLLELVGEFLVEVANGLGAVVVGINFFGNFAHLSGSQTFTIQPKAKLAHLLLLVAEHGPQHRLEVPKSVAGNPQAQLFSVATPWPGRERAEQIGRAHV